MIKHYLLLIFLIFSASLNCAEAKSNSEKIIKITLISKSKTSTQNYACSRGTKVGQFLQKLLYDVNFFEVDDLVKSHKIISANSQKDADHNAISRKEVDDIEELEIQLVYWSENV